MLRLRESVEFYRRVKMRVRWNAVGIHLLREAEIKRKIELKQIKKQIEILSTFVPDQVLNMPQNEMDEAQTFVGVLLFADVSGFTPLCERYNKTGKGGIYRLTATLNAYIGAIVEVIYFYGGDVLKFSGDAFLALWKAPPDVCLYEVIHNVIVCALFIQQTLGCFETEVNVNLKVKLAIACGNLTFSNIGEGEHRYYMLVGSAINDVKNAEHSSTSGDVVVAPSAWGHLAEESYEITTAEGGNVKIWNCLYSPNQKELKESYSKKAEIALALCEKHLSHRNRFHARKRIDDATTDSKMTEAFIASLPQRKAIQNAPLKWIPSDLNPFVIRPVQSQVEEKQPMEYLTEMREVTIQFINIVPSTYQEMKLIHMIDEAYKIVCKIVGKVRGVVNKVSVFDKDAMMLVLFGLRGVKHELESQNALRSAFEIRNQIAQLAVVQSVSVGVTNGLVYCGVVGHPFRREFTVIGGAVNKAARIMCAYEHKVTCDHETYRSCKLSSLYFQLQSALKLKGIEDAGNIFEYNENFDTTQTMLNQHVKMIGRETEMEFIDYIIKKPEKVGWYGICFRGESKVGKSKILRSVLAKHKFKMQYIASIVLNSAVQRPYYCISQLYKQLYDILATESPGDVRKLPRDLWDLNEILQERNQSSTDLLSVTSKEGILSKLIDCCLATNKGVVVLLIDNFQYVDSKSFQIIDVSLQKKKLRMICAGCFEEHTTWNTMWKLSLSNHVKLYNVESLKSESIIPLVCSFLNVKGVSKRLVIMMDKTCEGRPGWIQTCLLKLINNGELEVKYVNRDEDFVFMENIGDSALVLVAAFSKKFSDDFGELTLAAISLDIFDSFSPYQQLIIKTAAVLGDIFTRTILVVLLKYPNENVFATAIKNLCEEDVFECASKYINSGGLQEKRNVCLCFMEDDDYNVHQDLPRYAFCKLLHFKNKNLRNLAYEILPQNQKKELHLRITDILENQNNLCPTCLRDNSASLIVIRKFNDLIRYCHEYKYVWKEEVERDTTSTDEYKNVIREVIKNAAKTGKRRKAVPDSQIPRRKIWDPTVCFCLEILCKVYSDLIYHSDRADHLGKKIFFMYQFGSILLFMNEFESAIPIFTEASELSMVQINERYIFTGHFIKLMTGKIHFQLGNIYLRLNDVVAAKNHAMIALRQYNVPMISFTYSLPRLIMNRACLLRLGRSFEHSKLDNPLIKLHLGICLILVSNIYAVEGKWELAKAAASRSISYIQRTNPNIEILCDVYTSALHLYTYCGDMHICEKLERCFNSEMLKFYTKNVTNELFCLSKLLQVIFGTTVMNGNIEHSIKLGYRTLQLDVTLQAYFNLVEVIPTLSTLLLLVQRIDDAVHISRLLFNIGKKYSIHGYSAYYAFCIELMLEANFCLDRFDTIQSFAREFLSESTIHNEISSKLILGLHCHCLRKSKESPWRKFFDWNDVGEPHHFLGVLNLFRATECILLELERMIEQDQKIHQPEKKLAIEFLKKACKAANKYKLFMPRYLHYQAYYYKIVKKKRSAVKYLKEASALASTQGNILERCWIALNNNYWFGGFSFERSGIHCIDWKLAKTYSPLQWCHILYPLPFN